MRDVHAGQIAGVAGEQPIYLYQTVDYIGITPARGYGRPGGTRGPKVNQQFEASAFTHGPDGKPVNIGRVGPLTWDVAERVSRIGDDELYVGKVNPYGTFIAAADGPNPEREHSESNVGDVWVEAWYKPESVEAADGRAGLHAADAAEVRVQSDKLIR